MMLAAAAVAAALGVTSSSIEIVETASANQPTWPWDHDHWAVLIAGSAGYGNYRHQADVCHAYQIIKKQGVRPEHIIVLAVDDIASSFENPYRGKLFNKPTPPGEPGVDVYDGCVIDYRGSDVTPETFTKVLLGDAAGLAGVGSGKVLKSTKRSRVFVNFVDHGGVNIIGFPQTTMHAKELVSTLKTMHSNRMFKELVFYLEACESGSMFRTLPADIKIYATTAANGKESYARGTSARARRAHKADERHTRPAAISVFPCVSCMHRSAERQCLPTLHAGRGGSTALHTTKSTASRCTRALAICIP